MPDQSATDLEPAVDLRTPKTIHVVGVGGAGMSAIASVLAAMGHRVSGSDLKESAGLERLRAEGVDVAIGHRADNLRPDLDYVTISTAIPERNLEVATARERNIPVLRRAEMLGAIAATRHTVAVAGTHGKTTTSSMLALVLTQAGMHPSFIIGGDVNEIGSGAIWSDGAWFVVEADESDGTFVELPREAVVLTNVEPDHLEFHGSYEALLAAFDRFLAAASGPRLVCADDDVACEIGAAHGALTYGTSPSADFRMDNLALGRWGASFELFRDGASVGTVELPLAGLHNARNACAAVAMGLLLGAPFEAARAALAKFGGVARRFENRGEVDGITFIDDYAHLPTEVAAALAAARSGGWRRVVCVFQPHRYSRTASLWQDFGDAFVDADVLAITDVYAAGETPRPGVSGKLVVQTVLDAHPWARVAYLPHRADIVAFLRAELRPGDLCLTLGAGDLTSLPDEMQELLRPEHARVTDAVSTASEALGSHAQHEVPIGPLTTYRAGGRAALFVRAETDDDLAAVADAVQVSGVELLLIGKGSNLLVADSGFDGLAVTLGDRFAEITVAGTVVRAGGAASLPVVARRTAAAALTGFEWAVGVPGSIGGAVRMNAGGHGSDMAAHLLRVRRFDLRSGEDTQVSAADLALSFRRSNVAPHQLVVDAELQLAHGDRGEAEATIAEIVRWRRENQPGGANAGSVFVNPPDESAGRLVDISGCKGLRLGTAEVSPKHANFIQSDEGGSAADIFALMLEVQQRVHAHTGVRLRPETRLIGFAPSDLDVEHY